MRKNVRLKETNQAQQERQIHSQEELLQRKQREIQNLKQKIKTSNQNSISAAQTARKSSISSTNGYLNSAGNKRRSTRTRQNYLKVIKGL